MSERALRTMYFLFGAGIGAYFGTLAMSVADGWQAWALGALAIVSMTFAVAPWREETEP